MWSETHDSLKVTGYKNTLHAEESNIQFPGMLTALFFVTQDNGVAFVVWSLFQGFKSANCSL